MPRRQFSFADTNRTNADLAELWFYKNTLRQWGEMRKPGRPRPNVTFITPEEAAEEAAEAAAKEAAETDDGEGSRRIVSSFSPAQRSAGGITEGYGAAANIDDLVAGEEFEQGGAFDPSNLGEAAVAAPTNITLPGIDDDERFV